jgi:hypothetical protein
MMRRHAMALVVAALMATCMARVCIAQDDLTPVTVTGESAISFDDAEQRVLRDAVRQVAGVVLAADTKVADFALIRDAICSRAAGYVRSYKVLSKERGLDDAYVVKVYAEVARGAISDDRLAILNWIELMGRPQFQVTVKDRSDTEQQVATWVEGAVNDLLETTGLNVLHAATRDESIERAQRRAKLQGDATRAAQLDLMMGAPYGVEIVAFARKWSDRAFNLPLTNYKVELSAGLVARDTGEVLASKDAAGVAQDQGNLGTTSYRDASRRAVEAVFPEVLDRMLAHWLHDFDVGASVELRLYALPPAEVYALKPKLEGIPGVSQANVVEAPEGGIARMLVISRVKAADLAERIPALTGGRLRGYVEGPRMLSARPAEESRPATAPTGVSPPATRDEGHKAGAGYALPAAILGGCLLMGIVVAAIILRRR